MSGMKSESVSLSVSGAWLFMKPWTVAAHPQVPPSMEFPDKNIGVGSHAFLQGIFPTQGWNLGLLPCRQILYHLSHQEEEIKQIR